MQALHKGQQAPREATDYSKGWEVAPFFLSFHFMTSSLPTLASQLCSPSPFTPIYAKPIHHLILHPSVKSFMLPSLAHHLAHHQSFSSPQHTLGKEQSLRDAPKSKGELNLKIPTQAWQVPGHFCIKSNWHLPGKPQDCCSLPSGHRGGNVRSRKEEKALLEGKRGLLGAMLELLLPGNLTREKGGKASVPARQIQGPCIDDCRRNNSIFTSGFMPLICYSNYCSALMDDSTLQLVLDQCCTAGNKLGFLPMEVITIFNFEWEPWQRSLLLPWYLANAWGKTTSNCWKGKMV